MKIIEAERLDRPDREKIVSILLNVGQDFKLPVRRGSGITRKQFEETIADVWSKHLLALFPDEQEIRRKVVEEITFDFEDVHIFDTSYGYNQVRIDQIYMNEDSHLWQTLKLGKPSGDIKEEFQNSTIKG